MATLLRCPTFRAPAPSLATVSFKSLKSASLGVHFGKRSSIAINCLKPLRFSVGLVGQKVAVEKFAASASSGEATETEEVREVEVQEIANGGVDVKLGDDISTGEGKGDESSPILSSLQLFKEAVKNNEESTIAEVEALIKSIEDEKKSLEKKVESLSEELLVEKERILRISADFDNFRKRTERERLSLVTNAQGEVIEDLLPVLDNFERAKTQIKVETEGEEKIKNSYQSIYKQFVEILASTGVVVVETVSKPFDPLLHEAIMREESTEFEDGVIIEEYRKGFKLGDRLLRPSMVKVSAGPGPAKAKPEVSEEASSVGGADNATKIDEASEGETKDKTTP
ncbi:hypothetical protein Dimus_007556 [Dionaea muscipula]